MNQVRLFGKIQTRTFNRTGRLIETLKYTWYIGPEANMPRREARKTCCAKNTSTAPNRWFFRVSWTLFLFQLSLWTVLGFLEDNLFHRPVLCLLFSLRFFKKNLIVCSLNQDLTVLWFKDWVSIRKEGSIYPKSPLGSSFLTPGHFVQELLGKEKDAENYLFKRNERLSYFPFTNNYFKTFFVKGKI